MPRGVYPRKPKPGAFKLTVNLNREVFKCETEDIKAALVDLKPTNIKTRTIIRVENAFGFVERILMVRQAKLLFRNPLSMTIFVRNILKGLKTE